MQKVQVVAIIVSVIILFVVVELVRRGKLRENYSVLWICTSLVIIFFAIFRHLVDWLGKITGIYYGPSAFFLVAFLFLSLIALQFSVVISSLSQRNKNLAQEVALLKQKMKEIEGRGQGA